MARIPLHDHRDFNSGGLVASSTIITSVVTNAATSGGASAAADVSVADVAGNFAGEDVEAVLAELAAADAAPPSLALDDLTDVNAPAPVDQNVLTWDDGAGAWIAQAPTTPPPSLALDDLTDVAAPAPDNADVLTWDAGTSSWIAAPAPGAGGGDVTGQIVAGWDGGGAEILPGTQVDIVAPYTGTLTGWTLLAQPAGSAVVDVWLDTLGNFPPTDADSITAAAPPTLTADTDAAGSVGTWETAVTAGDVLRFNLDSVTDVQRLVLVLDYTRP